MSSETPLLHAYQFWIVFVISLILATIFTIGYIDTANWSAAVTYLVLLAVWGWSLIAFTYFLRGRGLPFEFLNNVPAWQLMFGVLVVPVIFFLAQGVGFLTGSQMQLISLIPELLPSVFSRLFGRFSFIDTLKIPVWMQMIGWHLGDVSTTETVFETGAMALLFLALYKKLKSWQKSRWPVFGLMSLVNLLWSGMHGILSYSSLNQFATAFLAGELLLSLILIFGSIIPTILGHAGWNILGVFGLLTLWPMIGLGILALILILALFLLRRKRR